MIEVNIILLTAMECVTALIYNIYISSGRNVLVAACVKLMRA